LPILQLNRDLVPGTNVNEKQHPECRRHKPH
jgi:hypothetical protein